MHTRVLVPLMLAVTACIELPNGEPDEERAIDVSGPWRYSATFTVPSFTTTCVEAGNLTITQSGATFSGTWTTTGSCDPPRAELTAGGSGSVSAGRITGTSIRFMGSDACSFEGVIAEPHRMSGTASCAFSLGAQQHTATGTWQAEREPPISSLRLNFARIAAGHVHTCGVTTAGAAYCWGSGSHGELGNGFTEQRRVPSAVAGGIRFADVYPNNVWHTCGRATTGSVYCWGANRDGLFGDGSTLPSLTPKPAAGGIAFVELSVERHACGVTSEGAAYCWGPYFLGDGSHTGSTSPVRVAGDLTFRTISVGNSYTCALTVSGSPYCWGSNIAGMLGDSTTMHRLVPEPVKTGLVFTSISASRALDVNHAHTCAVANDGSVWCWGAGGSGQLGDGATQTRLAPVRVAGGVTFASVVTGNRFSCGLTAAGAAYCWGQNDMGQLGNGTTVPSLVPVPVAGGHIFAMLSAGVGYACGVTVSHVALCWGSNRDGQLGTGTNIERSSVPVRVAGQSS